MDMSDEDLKAHVRQVLNLHPDYYFKSLYEINEILKRMRPVCADSAAKLLLPVFIARVENLEDELINTIAERNEAQDRL